MGQRLNTFAVVATFCFICNILGFTLIVGAVYAPQLWGLEYAWLQALLFFVGVSCCLVPAAFYCKGYPRQEKQSVLAIPIAPIVQHTYPLSCSTIIYFKSKSIDIPSDAQHVIRIPYHPFKPFNYV